MSDETEKTTTTPANRKVEFRFFKDYFEGEVIEENVPGKDLFPETEELHDRVYMRVKRDSDGAVFGVHRDQTRELNN